MNENMVLYDRWRMVPQEAKKAITAGRLKGFTDISPMWRIQQLTEMFGPCGLGWVALITRSWIDEGPSGEKVCNIEIALKYRIEGKWSEPVLGIGGSLLVAKERNGLYTDDEAYKKAYTDALSVACRSLGMGADVYWERGGKYEEKSKTTQPEKEPPAVEIQYADVNAREALYVAVGKDRAKYEALLKKYKVSKDKIPMDVYDKMYKEVWNIPQEEKLPWEE
ncbi:hypothetical protein KP626_07130 [Christensenella sp. MSJ-20]|uniref:hypothetical protein n=1 Tax=Christensenella sp. MSJ-20 TaxID=2841518 RepID=UPI001C76425E|nr:hypothetical protein KP626_07130 [Christensenella sp. MSJ-20]